MSAQIYADPPAASARHAGIPAAVDSVLATALAKNPADRYTSCGRFAAELRAALGQRPGEPAGPPPQSPAPRGIGPVSEPRPTMPGRVLLRVKQRQPGTGGRQAPAKDPPAVATDRPAGAGSLEPAPAWEPVTAWEPAPAGEPATAGDPVGPDPEPPARRIRPRGPVLPGIRARRPVLAAGAARRPVWAGLGAAHRRPPGRHGGKVQADGGAGQLADGRPGLPVLGPAAADRRMHADQPVERLQRRVHREPAGRYGQAGLRAGVE